jgi:hypothetical protein
MTAVTEQEKPILTEVANVVHGEQTVCREYVVFSRESLYDLTVGTPSYVRELLDVNPEYAQDRILVVQPEVLADPLIATQRLAEHPALEDFLIEQTPEDPEENL